MERLPYIDEHAISLRASRADAWSALLQVMCRDPHDPSTVPTGFVLDEARPPTRFAMKGRHPFAVYRWVFELEPVAAGTRLRAISWAAFPGIHGKIYRALVIGTGGHRLAVRWTLNRVATQVRSAARARSGTDYLDVFEAALLPGDARTAEQAFRDALGQRPSALGSLVSWIHRHVLGLRLGPYSSPDHIIGWPIVRSDRDEVVLATRGPLMCAELTLRRHDGRATLTTRLHYSRRMTARVVWAMVGPLHRVVAPRLMQRSVRRGLPALAGR